MGSKSKSKSSKSADAGPISGKSKKIDASLASLFESSVRSPAPAPRSSKKLTIA